MAIITNNFKINTSGDIKWTNTSTNPQNYTVKEFHNLLVDQMKINDLYFEQIETRKKLIDTLKKL